MKHRDPYVDKIDMKALAEFVEEALAGLGILDDADEILDAYKEHNGVEGVRTAQKHYNNAIAFRNEHIDNGDGPLAFITDEDLEDYGLLDE